MDTETLDRLGPLSHLIGVWEGDKGDDVAPADDRGTENNKYRERLTFTPAGMVENHEQKLYALRYSTMAWRIGEPNPFHEELGYWTWEPETQQILRTFVIPRGVALIASGTAARDAREFTLDSKLGSETNGVLVNAFLAKEFKIVSFQLKVKILGEGAFSYWEDTVMQMPGRKDLFHHVDQNILKRMS